MGAPLILRRGGVKREGSLSRGKLGVRQFWGVTLPLKLGHDFGDQAIALSRIAGLNSKSNGLELQAVPPTCHVVASVSLQGRANELYVGRYTPM